MVETDGWRKMRTLVIRLMYTIHGPLYILQASRRWLPWLRVSEPCIRRGSMIQRVPRGEAVFLQTSSPTLISCGGYDFTARSGSFSVPFDHCDWTHVARRMCPCQGRSVWRVPHGRRNRPRTCWRWLAEHRQLVYQRLAGIQNNHSLAAHEIGRRESFFG